MARHSNRSNLYEEVTAKIISDLEDGRVPWVQPWGTDHVNAALGLPRNAGTHRNYSGINILILWGAVIEHHHSHASKAADYLLKFRASDDSQEVAA